MTNLPYCHVFTKDHFQKSFFPFVPDHIYFTLQSSSFSSGLDWPWKQFWSRKLKTVQSRTAWHTTVPFHPQHPGKHITSVNHSGTACSPGPNSSWSPALCTQPCGPHGRISSRTGRWTPGTHSGAPQPHRKITRSQRSWKEKRWTTVEISSAKSELSLPPYSSSVSCG